MTPEEIRLRCIEIATANLAGGTPFDNVVRVADKLADFVLDGTVPAKDGDQ